MSTFIAEYILLSRTAKKRNFLFVQEKLNKKCKKVCDWYASVDYTDISVRYAPVMVVEWSKINETY